jgi:outer membrane cobalamin receptor
VRFPYLCAVVLLLIASAFASDLKIRVLDPQSAAVAGAQVELLKENNSFLVAVTTSEGIAVFRNLADEGAYSFRVLAPGFAEQTVAVPKNRSEIIAVHLELAPASETISITATRTPIASEAVGANVETLTAAQISTMNPVAMNDALRFLPGASIATTGQRGGLSSLFVQGGESRYNKVIIDGVPVDEPGGTFDFGTVPLAQADRLEFLRGAQSTLYGSDAMTSVVQIWTRTGSTATPEFEFGADGGNLYTAHGYASLAGARGPFDYNVYADQFNTSGQGINNDYSNSLQGGNLGYAINDSTSLRVRVRHSNSRTGVPGEWNFNGTPIFPPDSDQRARQNNLLGSVELDFNASPHWQNRFTGFDYHHQRENLDTFVDPGRAAFDFQSHGITDINRAGFAYQGNFQERTWTQTTFGYEFEDENGFIGDLNFPPLAHGLRLNHGFYGQQLLTLGRLTVVAGARFQHIGTFGNNGAPRVALTLQALRGGSVFSGTSLRFTYATGFKEPTLDQTFAAPPFSVPNLNLKPERNRSFEAGLQQGLFGGKYSFIATYFNNLFLDRVDYAIDQMTFIGQFVNVDKSFAQGAVLEFQGKLLSRLTLNSAYSYTSTQNLEAPLCTPANFCDPVFAAGTPLLRRPKHSGTLLLTYLGHRWGGNLGGSFVGRRPDDDFLGQNILHAAGYARVDLGGWHAITSRVTAYVNVENALNKHYNEVVGYPALLLNFRAGLRFRLGGE